MLVVVRGTMHSIDRAAQLLRERAGGELACAIVLGSGLAGAFRSDPALRVVSYAEIGGLPPPTALGHVGDVLVGMLRGRRVAVFCGRFHLYEGRSARDVASIVELAASAGARTIVLTNAAGALNLAYAAGDLMLVRDHLNLTGANPLRGILPRGVVNRFVDMREAYAPALRDVARAVAVRHGFRVHDGVYAGLLGPSFETPAEVAMLRLLGADAVGMSTVLETIAARALGCAVLGVSLITNVHDGAAVSSDEVVREAARVAPAIAAFLAEVVARAA